MDTSGGGRSEWEGILVAATHTCMGEHTWPASQHIHKEKRNAGQILKTSGPNHPSAQEIVAGRYV